MTTIHPLPIGCRVEKLSGYKWPGVVVAVFNNINGDLRYVVECTVPEVEGALHIYSPQQLKRRGYISSGVVTKRGG